MINRFFAFVPGVKHLVALKAICLSISSLLNIGLVYVFVGILSPVLRPIHTSHQSLITTVELTSYLVAFVGIAVIKYLILRWSYSLGGDISTHVAMRLRPKMLHAILSLRAIKDNDSPYSFGNLNYDTKSSKSISVNNDVVNMQFWCGLFVPQVFASVVTPLVISIVLFSVNPSIAAISLMTAIFTIATSCCAFFVDVSSTIRCLCAFFAYIAAAAAIISTIWISSIRTVGLPSAMLTMPLLMLSIEPLRRCGRYMHMANSARSSFIRIYYLLNKFANSSSLNSFTDDSTKLTLPDGANNLVLHVSADLQSESKDPNEGSYNLATKDSKLNSDYSDYSNMTFVARAGSLNVIPAKFNEIMKSKVFSCAGFSTDTKVELTYNDRYELDDSSDYSSYSSNNYNKNDSPFVEAKTFDLEKSSSISLCGAKPGALADLVSVVSNRSHLFDDTLRANLLMAAPLATTTSMWEALREARIDGMVYADYDGLDLRIDRLKNLSKENNSKACIMRKLVLARAILRHTPVYIVDFSNDYMDESEAAKICAILRKLARKSIVIALMPASAQEYGVIDKNSILDISLNKLNKLDNKTSENKPNKTKVTNSSFSQISAENATKSSIYRSSENNSDASSFASPNANAYVTSSSSQEAQDAQSSNKESKSSRFVYWTLRLLKAILSTFATAISVFAAIFIPVCTVAAMFAIAGRSIFGFTMKECLQGALICMFLRLITLIASFAGIDLHHSRQRKITLTMTLGLTIASIPAFLLLWYFNIQLMIISIVVYVLAVLLIPWYRFMRSEKILKSMNNHMQAVEREVKDIELGIDEVLAFRLGERCVDNMIQTMERLATQRMRLARRLGGMCSLIMSLSLTGMMVGMMVIAQNVHPNPANVPSWSTVYAVMAVIVLASLLKQMLDVVLRRTPWVVNASD